MGFLRHLIPASGCLLLGVVSSCDSNPAAQPGRPPNILLLVWDTVRADRLSAYGYESGTSPWLEEFARHGVLYERAVSPAVWTLPSHASLFTGLPVTSHGVHADHEYLEDEFVTMAEALQAARYDTYAFVANPYLMPAFNIYQGFEKVEHPWRPPWKRKARAELRQKLIATDASTTLSPAWDPEGKFKAVGEKYAFKEAGGVAREALLGWLRDRPDPERPYFAFINYMEAHLPRLPALESRRRFLSDELIRRALQVEQTPNAMNDWMIGKREYSADDLTALNGIYDACLFELDRVTGQLIEDLESNGFLDNTIVVLTSDHGENIGDHGLMLHRYSVHNSLSRVPLVIHWPGKLAPGRVKEPYCVSEVFRTLIELADLPVSEQVSRQLESLPGPEQGAFTEYNAVDRGFLNLIQREHPDVSIDRYDRTLVAVEKDAYKLIMSSAGSRELFDVVADPQETRDQAEHQPSLLERMAQLVERWRAAIPHLQGSGSAPELGEEDWAELEALGYVRDGGDP